MFPSAQLATTANRENILYDACECLAGDLLEIEPALFAAFFHFGEARFVCEQVNSILDRHFIKGSMNFACTGDSLVTWGEPPVVAIDLEFVSDAIFAFFRIVLTGNVPVVELHHITFHESSGDTEENTKALHEAVAKAKSRKHTVRAANR